jgi:hypothetical protein
MAERAKEDDGVLPERLAHGIFPKMDQLRKQ